MINAPKAVVQIGLHKSCEYVYLVDEKYWHNWKIPLRLSEFEVHQNWHYFGVDMNPESIERCQNFDFLKGDSRINFIEALVHKEDNKVLAHDNFIISDEGSIQTSSISLQTLFSKIPMDIGLLAIDVEGAEVSILEGYSWEIKPMCIVVEIHRCNDLHTITNLLKHQNYRFAEILQQNTNIQCGYIHKSCLTNRVWWIK